MGRKSKVEEGDVETADGKRKGKEDHPWPGGQFWYFWRVSYILTLQALIVVGFHVANSLSFFWLNEHLAMTPRKDESLPMILIMPLLHSGLKDLMTNLIFFEVLSSIVLMGKHPGTRYTAVLLMAWIPGGFMLWAIGRDRVYRGLDIVNGTIFGMLVVIGFIEKTWKSTVIAIVVFVVYILMLFELQWNSVWEMEVCGLTMGVFTAAGIALGARYDSITEEKEALLKK